MGKAKFIFRVHAIQRMFERHISDQDVKHVIQTGETIEDYPEDKPYPSRLILGWSEPALFISSLLKTRMATR